ncbi:hypothetical protein FHG87_002739 [Trinorchestia longiramus]|nr:hypothetical protein FHG87_002739 [Trinorchestia longiramus]
MGPLRLAGAVAVLPPLPQHRMQSSRAVHMRSLAELQHAAAMHTHPVDRSRLSSIRMASPLQWSLPQCLVWCPVCLQLGVEEETHEAERITHNIVFLNEKPLKLKLLQRVREPAGIVRPVLAAIRHLGYASQNLLFVSER